MVRRVVASWVMLVLLPVAGSPWCALEPAVALNERAHLIKGGHEVGTAGLGDHDGATGVGQACGLVPAPPLDEAAQQPGGKGIPCPQDILHLHREAGYIDLRGETAVGHQMDA